MAELLRLEGISYRIGDKKILDSISFSLDEGEIFGLLGPNGAGKSTTMKIIAGLLEQSAGHVYLNGKNAGWGQDGKSAIAMVPQEPAFLYDLTVEENLVYFASQIGVAGQKADEVMKQFGLEQFATRPAKHLSGGYRQLLNIAIGTLQSPKLLILDEPSVGLDPVTRSRLWDRIFEIQQMGISVCISTHYMEEAQALCQRVCLINEGRMEKRDVFQIHPMER